MGMFDVVEVEPQQLARQVFEDLREFLNKGQSAERVTLSFNQNHITMRAPEGQSVTIVVDGPDAFRVGEDLGNKGGLGQRWVTMRPARWSLSERPFGRDELVRRARMWLSEH